MSQYKTGTVAVTNGSPNIVGNGTLWAANAAVGQTFMIKGSNVPYVIGAVTDDTHITLSSNYAGVFNYWVSYEIYTSRTPVLGIKYMEQGDIDTATTLKRAAFQIEALLQVAALAQLGVLTDMYFTNVVSLAQAALNAGLANAATNASTAAAASTAAQAAWTAALAANPDLNPAVRMNPTTFLSDVVIPSGYNAYSAGPLTIGEGVNVTLTDNSQWTII